MVHYQHDDVDFEGEDDTDDGKMLFLNHLIILFKVSEYNAS